MFRTLHRRLSIYNLYQIFINERIIGDTLQLFAITHQLTSSSFNSARIILKRKLNGALCTHNSQSNNECFMYIQNICSKQTYTIHYFFLFALLSAYFFIGDAHRMASHYIAKMIVGILFIVIGSLNINRNNEQSAAIILNDVILICIFFISIINVVISAFGIEHASKPLEKIN